MISPNAIYLDYPATCAEEAIRQSGDALRDAGACSEQYTQAMIDSFHQFGPYFVIAPGLAMPHARPENGAIAPQISLVQLREPVAFGHAENDPVKLVLGLSATNSDQHIQLIQKIVTLLGDEDNLQTLMNSHDTQQIYDLMIGEE